MRDLYQDRFWVPLTLLAAGLIAGTTALTFCMVPLAECIVCGGEGRSVYREATDEVWWPAWSNGCVGHSEVRVFTPTQWMKCTFCREEGRTTHLMKWRARLAGELILEIGKIEWVPEIYYCPDSEITPPEVRRMRAKARPK